MFLDVRTHPGADFLTLKLFTYERRRLVARTDATRPSATKDHVEKEVPKYFLQV